MRIDSEQNVGNILVSKGDMFPRMLGGHMSHENVKNCSWLQYDKRKIDDSLCGYR